MILLYRLYWWWFRRKKGYPHLDEIVYLVHKKDLSGLGNSRLIWLAEYQNYEKMEVFAKKKDITRTRAINILYRLWHELRNLEDQK